MDPQRFDELTRSLVTTVHRRRAVKAGMGGALAGALAALRRSPARAGVEPTCSADECTDDEECRARALGGADCVCNKDEAGAQGGTPAKGTCGTRGPVTCLAVDCRTDGDCAQGVPNCTCRPDGKCGTGGGGTCSPEPCTGDPECQERAGDASCVCTDAGTCGTDGCTPRTCRQIGAQCGVQPDTCGGTVNCGPCPGGSRCDNGICRPKPCRRETREEACRGLDCGTVSDGCDGEYDCGTCPKDERCLGNRCKPKKPGDRCPGHGLAGTPCNGKCKCRGGRRCHNGRCCEPVGDGSVHCNSDSDCCPGLECARKAGGRHKTCLRKPIGRAAISLADITAP